MPQLRTALVLLTLVGSTSCRETASPPYVRLEGTSPAIESPPPTRSVLVVFWASWCEPCRKETAELRELAADPLPDLSVVVFSHDGEMNAVRGFFRGEPDPALNLRLDSGYSAAASFGVDVLPASILVVDGLLVARFAGAREWNSAAMRQLLRKLTAEAFRARG